MSTQDKRSVLLAPSLLSADWWNVAADVPAVSAPGGGAGAAVRTQDKRSVLLAPSLLSADWWNVAADVAELTRAGCQWLHFDAMDGHFVPNLTMGPMFLRALRPHSKLHFDAHLMLANPGEYINEFLEAG